MIGIGCAWICYRARLPHLSFALAALGFVYMGLYLGTAMEGVTGGTRGLTLRPASDPANMMFADKATYYYMALFMASGAVALSWWISRSRLGYYLSAIRGICENNIRADNEFQAEIWFLRAFRQEKNATIPSADTNTSAQIIVSLVRSGRVIRLILLAWLLIVLPVINLLQISH
jgi:hypothetical protein